MSCAPETPLALRIHTRRGSELRAWFANRWVPARQGVSARSGTVPGGNRCRTPRPSQGGARSTGLTAPPVSTGRNSQDLWMRFSVGLRARPPCPARWGARPSPPFSKRAPALGGATRWRGVDRPLDRSGWPQSACRPWPGGRLEAGPLVASVRNRTVAKDLNTIRGLEIDLVLLRGPETGHCDKFHAASPSRAVVT